MRLPSLQVPQPLNTDLLRGPVERLVDTRVLADVRGLRRELVDSLLRRHPDIVEADPRGEPAVRGEILAWSPSAEGLTAARTLGLAVVREERSDELGLHIVVLRAPQGAATARLLEALRMADPAGTYDFNHLYTGSGNATGIPAGSGPAAVVGLVDSGVDAGHAVFDDADIRRDGCGGTAQPHAHGTAVAALLVGRADGFKGVAPEATLFAYDVYCDSPTGGSALEIGAALAWMAKRNVGVVNVSLVGPSNEALRRTVAAMVARGHLLVAAVGNDGPAAPPLYPASYPGVVGVTGVDRRGRPLPEAARGPQVMFAAPGSQMISASPGSPPFRQVRGTSYAAPIVAALLATRLPHPDPVRAQAAVTALAQEAVAGADRNAVGNGVVGAALRNDPSAMR
ncbi:hypothetical protein EWM63_02980 [Pseudoduganella lutea]|uniref:Peptidase S8/S53 domain-containing protein n=1 Tax=Pseudoduganella lutea TaxID=321985 RepID=A0A4P6L6N5_9BURK|nr:hypothetical protein EWM63_02980 [Pseudoduganella lutea]